MEAGRESMEDSMRFARINTTSVSVGLVISVLGLGMILASPADARKANNRQRAYVEQQAALGTMPRNTPPSNVLCWTTCGQPSSIVLGADPDPFIRSQLLRDASRYFGGGSREELTTSRTTYRLPIPYPCDAGFGVA